MPTVQVILVKNLRSMAAALKIFPPFLLNGSIELQNELKNRVVVICINSAILTKTISELILNSRGVNH